MSARGIASKRRLGVTDVTLGVVIESDHSVRQEQPGKVDHANRRFHR
jgi:hypothetical protein